jgi:diguanylate cyclase (GGDEF)-like protein/PAS domain S-box-containing protein
MARLDQSGAEREVVLTRFRLGLLTCASLIAPVIGIIHELRVGDVDYLVVRVASGTLFVLVILRMAGLVRQQERSLERERVLSRAGAELVAASSSEEIDRVAVRAAASLGGPGTIAALCRVGSEASTTFVASDGPLADVTARKLPHGRIASVNAESGETIRMTGVEAAALGLHGGNVRAFVVPLEPRRAEPVSLVLAGGNVLGAVRVAGRALATQVALALDSAVLTEEVHRRRGEARFGSLVRHASDLITVLDPELRITYQSPSVERVLGYSAEEVIGRPFTDLVCKPDRARLERLVSEAIAADEEAKALECSLLQKDGGRRPFEILFTNLLTDEHVGGFVLNARDVSERKIFEDELTHQAFHDTVTGLANRTLFSERVRHAIARAQREKQSLAVIFLDLDDFKTINDSLGHAAGDQVLVEVARRLDATVRGADTAARFGGDEFAVLLEDVSDSQHAADTAQRILEALSAPTRAGHKELALRASLGISVAVHNDVRNAEELIRDADAAMYIAKRDGKGTYQLFEPRMHEGVLARLELRTDLQRAIATDQLELYYQPVVRLADASVVGVEALLRWRHPERGMIVPGDFVPIAEETGLIIPIGRWVLREGCRHARRILRARPHERYSMAINLSLKQIQHSDIVADVRDALADSGLAAERLTLEITESVLMHDTELAVERLEDLKALGVRLALDDFGTGYSSLSYLSRFPVDILKMDRSFLREGSSPNANGLASAVVGLGTTLSLEVVAEGIEEEQQWHALRELGCGFGQGFLFAGPMNADASLAFLAAQLVPSVDAA